MSTKSITRLRSSIGGGDQTNLAKKISFVNTETAPEVTKQPLVVDVKNLSLREIIARRTHTAVGDV
jgi:hypothetical protein